MELSPSPPPHCHPFSRRRNASHGCHGVHFRFAHSTRVECGHRRLKVRQAPLKTSFDIKIKLTQCVSLFSTGLWKRSSLNQKSSFSDNFNLLLISRLKCIGVHGAENTLLTKIAMRCIDTLRVVRKSNQHRASTTWNIRRITFSKKVAVSNKMYRRLKNPIYGAL